MAEIQGSIEDNRINENAGRIFNQQQESARARQKLAQDERESQLKALLHGKDNEQKLQANAIDAARYGVMKSPVEENAYVQDPSFQHHDKRDPLDVLLKGEQYKNAVLEGKQKQEHLQGDPTARRAKAQVPGYQVNEGYIPEEKDAESIKSSSAAHKDMMNLTEDMKSHLSKANRFDMMSPTSEIYQNLKRANSALTVQAKEMAKLGVLSGPDMKLVEDMNGSTTGLSAAALGPEQAIKNINEVQRLLNNKMAAQAEARGYKAPVGVKRANESPAMAVAVDPTKRLEELRAKYRK